MDHDYEAVFRIGTPGSFFLSSGKGGRGGGGGEGE